MIGEAVQQTDYYAELFARASVDPALPSGFMDFLRIPVLEKADVFRAGNRLISKKIDQKLLRADSTGGSTGAPVKILAGPEEDGWMTSAHDYFFLRIGVPPGSRFAYLWGHHLDPTQQDSLRQRISSYIHNVRWFDCFRLSPEILASHHEKMQKWKPDCIVAYASALVSLAQFLNEKGIVPGYPNKCIVTGAEKLFDSQREIVERVFQKPVHERYGSRDAGLMAFQLDVPASKDFSIDWPNLLLEPEFEHPESPILVTKLHADGMPMIRYRIGDVAVFPEASRPGHPVFYLHSVLGRIVDKVWLMNGTFIHGTQFPHMMKEFPVREFMVVQAPDYSVEMLIVPAPDFNEIFRERLMKSMANSLAGLPFSIKLVDAIPKTEANKWRPVISHVLAHEAPRVH